MPQAGWLVEITVHFTFINIVVKDNNRGPGSEDGNSKIEHSVRFEP
jgi:hypothetical protein